MNARPRRPRPLTHFPCPSFTYKTLLLNFEIIVISSSSSTEIQEKVGPQDAKQPLTGTENNRSAPDLSFNYVDNMEMASRDPGGPGARARAGR